MTYKFLEIASTPSVIAAQQANGSRQMWERVGGDRTFDRFTGDEAAFIAARDSFYMATVSETGWPSCWQTERRGWAERRITWRAANDARVLFAIERGVAHAFP